MTKLENGFSTWDKRPHTAWSLNPSDSEFLHGPHYVILRDRGMLNIRTPTIQHLKVEEFFERFSNTDGQRLMSPSSTRTNLKSGLGVGLVESVKTVTRRIPIRFAISK
jgi:hypothetical protein